jgi:hypothetical protein
LGSVTYKDDWKNGVPFGKGILYYENGDTYDGEFIYSNIKLKNNNYNILKFQKNGNGTYTWTNGNTYIGRFVNDKKDGFGIHKLYNGTIYEQYWKNDLLKSKYIFIIMN